ncbi:hypothetical protein A2U01_0106743, partial [Trifolium medium]|nr:hypothetical protein [Trifolium medium]
MVKFSTILVFVVLVVVHASAARNVPKGGDEHASAALNVPKGGDEKN